ncbi:hypothetical protein ABEF79_08505 [Acinetobacter sp. ANC 7454]|uniref:hypothetical protein n=1 Tax=Acinetobacter thermotolerans TaxID=3151487 RepID=UPI00325BDB50
MKIWERYYIEQCAKLSQPWDKELMIFANIFIQEWVGSFGQYLIDDRHIGK